MTKLYLIRHGESEANHKRLFAGHSNFDLTDLGRRQARCAADWFDGVPVDRIVASDLLRAFNTAAPLSEKRQIATEPCADFREIFAGEWEGVSFSEIEKKHPTDYAVWRTDIGNAHCTGGETVRHLGQRVLAAITKLAEESDGQSVVIATHATPIRVLLSLWQTGDVLAMKEISWVSNASITAVRYENGIFTPESIGATNHLQDLLTKLPTNV